MDEAVVNIPTIKRNIICTHNMICDYYIKTPDLTSGRAENDNSPVFNEPIIADREFSGIIMRSGVFLGMDTVAERFRFRHTNGMTNKDI